MTTPPPPSDSDGSTAPGGGTSRRRIYAIGGGALLVAVVAVVAIVVATSGNGDGTRLAGNHSSESASPAPSDTGVKSHQLSASPKASKKAQPTEPPPHQPPATLSDKVDWSPFTQAYGAATSAASDSKAASNGVTQLRASQPFGDYNASGTVSVTATAQYFASAGAARDQYDSLCGGGSGKKSGSLATASIGDKACSYLSDVSDGSSGTAILYVQVLRANVLLQVAPMAFHNGAWSAADLATLRAVSVRSAGDTIAKL